MKKNNKTKEDHKLLASKILREELKKSLTYLIIILFFLFIALFINYKNIYSVIINLISLSIIIYNINNNINNMNYLNKKYSLGYKEIKLFKNNNENDRKKNL
jgi:hypothetical protein